MSFSDEYLKLRMKRLRAEKAGEIAPVSRMNYSSRDIAPVSRTNYSSTNIAPVAPEKESLTEEEKKDGGWFTKGAFEDGYQFGDVLKTISGTSRDLQSNVLAGILGIGEGVVDAGATLAGGVGKLFGADEFAEKTADFVAKDLYDEKKIAKKLIMPDLSDIGWSAEENSIMGDKADELAQSGGQLLGTIGLQAVGVPWYLTTGVTSFGSEAENAFKQDATYGEAITSGLVAAGAEMLTEKLFGGSGLGETGLINLAPLTKGIASKGVKVLADLGVDMLAESGEEIASEFLSTLGQQLSYEKEATWGELLTNEQAMDDYISQVAVSLFGKEARERYFDAAIGGAALGGVANTGKAITSAKTGRDYRTGLTDNEQKVFNVEVENRIAEAEKDGKKLTKAEKADIEKQVENDMDMGYISTDTIESVLGGDTYKAYKDTVDAEDALFKEYEELGKVQNPTLAQQSQYAKLEAKVEETKKNSQRNNYKSMLSDNVSKIVENDRLFESYRENERRGQAFDADLTQYNEKQQKVIKKAIESGILNNSNRTHAFVDMVAKLSADKGVLFDFTNNENLKKSGFAVDGKFVNGYVTKDGITVNIDSHKSLNSVVGHEISHVLEGTELYTELQKAVFEYAKTKKDFDGRHASLSELYKNIKDADVDSELTADLVGDYLFTDEDFINNLSTKHRNVFQKIYDEIKYLCKIATAGSKEARELERVKRAFEKAYRESGKASTDTKYSLSDSEGKELSKEQQEYFKDSKVRDENGNLLKVYHGSASQFNTFSHKFLNTNGNAHGRGFYFTEDKNLAEGYHKDGGQLLEGYLNITKPMSEDKVTMTKQGLVKLIKATCQEQAQSMVDDGEHDNINDASRDTWVSNYVDTYSAHNMDAVYREVADIIYEDCENDVDIVAELTNAGAGNETVLRKTREILGYDGVIYTNEYTGAHEYVTLESNQFKNANNTEPTANPDIRYSLAENKETDKLNKVGLEYDETSKSYSPTRYSLSTWSKSDYVSERDKVASEMAKHLSIASQKATEYIDSVNSIAKMIADDKVRLDYEASPGKSSFVSNAEYGGSIDFSTICKKRRLFTGTFEAIQNALPNTALTADEVLEIRRMMADKGYEVSCGLCYVEGSRANMGQFTKQFIERYKATNPDYVPNMAEMNTATGQERIRKEHPEVYEAYEYFMNHYGKLNPNDKALFASQQKPKMYQMSTEYKGEILEKFGKNNKTVAEKNKNGGLRLQSFSDFEIIHLIDSMQVIMDMSRVGLAGQAYTKVPDFAWALGDTGLKINLSLIAKGVDENGRLALDETEGMKEADAMALRDRYSDNVGTIIVVFTDQQLKAAMADERIDYIIPYHRSQWKTDQYELMGLPANTKDYTPWQNESYIEPVYNQNGKKLRPDNYMPNTYWDFNKSGKENAEAYLRMCADNNRRPKFSHLLVDNHDGSYSLQPDGSTDGYWKTLIDFKMYNNEGVGVPQSPVSPIFNMDESKRMLTEYNGGHSKFPVAQDIVDEFVAKYHSNDVRHSLSEVGEQPKQYGNFHISGKDVAYVPQDVAPVAETVSKTEQVQPISEEKQAPIGTSNEAIAELATHARLESLRGAYTYNGKQYISDGAFAVELNTVDDTLDQADEFPAKRVLKELDEAFERQIPGNYEFDYNEIVELGKGKRSFVKIGDTLFDAKYVSATLQSIKNPVISLSRVRGGYKALIASGDNGRVMLMPVRAGENVSASYVAQPMKHAPFTEDLAPISEEDANAIQIKNLASLGDADAPPETVAPYYGESESVEPSDPFENRDIKAVGNRKVKAYMYENPEVKPFFQAEANLMLGELRDTTKGERWYNDELYYESNGEYGFSGTKRHTTADIEYLLDTLGYSYAEIEKGLNAIIEDNGKENNACSKRIEFLLNDRLMNGYQDISGFPIPANQDYINLLNEKQIMEYTEEARKKFFDTAENYIPYEATEETPAIKKPPVDDVAPIAESNPELDAMQAEVDRLQREYDATLKQFNHANRTQNTEAVHRLSERLSELNQQLSKAEVDLEFAKNKANAETQTVQPTAEAEVRADEDIAPVYHEAQNVGKDGVEGQQAMFPQAEEKAKEQTEQPTTGKQIGMFDEEPKIAQLVDEPESSKKKNRAWSKFRTNFLDKGSVFEDLSLETGNRELQAKWNHTLSSESRAQWMIGNGAGMVKSLNDIKSEVETNGNRNKAFEDYLYHVHNVDRMSIETEEEHALRMELRKQFNGMSDKQIEKLAMNWINKDTSKEEAARIKAAREYMDASKHKNKPVFGYSVTADVSREKVKNYEAKNPQFKKWAQDVYDYNKHLRKLLVDGNVISQETADLWAKMYPHYVPIRRLGDSGVNINVPLDSRKTGVNAPVKRATGGNEDILPLFDTMAMRTEQTFKALARNSFGVELMHTLDSVVEDDADKSVGMDEVMDSVDNQEELLQKGEKGKNPTFTVFENGKRVTFEITEDMYDALKPTSDGLKSEIKPLSTANKIFRGLLTEYNPVFTLTNAAKDVQDIVLNSQHPVQTYKNLPKAVKELTTKGKWYQEYMANGGEQNTYFDGQSKTFTEEDKGIKKVIGIPLRKISSANNFVERMPRLAEYIASREAGASIETAMLDAARVTTNFAAGGDYTKWANRNGATFLNASVQGTLQQVRNVREAKANGLKGVAQLATKFALVGLPAVLLNHLLWDDDEEYEELSDYVKDNYYIVAKFGDGKFVRIPKGRMVSVIQNAFEQMDNVITGDDEADWSRFGELLISNLAPNNPVEDNIFAPIFQAANNKTWYGEDLVPTRLQDLPAAEQYDESTDAISKWLGEKTNISPYKINYLLNQYSGGVGDVVLPMLTPEAEGGYTDLEDYVLAPFTDKFTTDSVMNNQNVSDFYDTVDELAKNANSSYATDEDVLSYKYMNSVNAELSELYKQKREIQNSDLKDSEKYEAVRDIQKEIDYLAKKSLQTYDKVVIDDGYARVGDRYYRMNDKGQWQKLTDKQLEQQNDVISDLQISPSEYWENKSEYDFAHEYPEKYAVARSVGGYEPYKTYISTLYDIKADKDKDGKSIRGSRKKKVVAWLNKQDMDYGMKLILFKSEYNADDSYNYEIIDYLNEREDISYEDMEAILKELGFTVDKEGNITWD